MEAIIADSQKGGSRAFKIPSCRASIIEKTQRLIVAPKTARIAEFMIEKSPFLPIWRKRLRYARAGNKDSKRAIAMNMLTADPCHFTRFSHYKRRLFNFPRHSPRFWGVLAQVSFIVISMGATFNIENKRGPATVVGG